VGTQPRGPSPSGARSLSKIERLQLYAVAEGLPEGWVVSVSEGTGQLGICPYEYLDPYEAYAVHVSISGECRLRRRIPERFRRSPKLPRG
jgi:hypothetical protein